jgi:hypothetical protein
METLAPHAVRGGMEQSRLQAPSPAAPVFSTPRCPRPRLQQSSTPIVQRPRLVWLFDLRRLPRRRPRPVRLSGTHLPIAGRRLAAMEA